MGITVRDRKILWGRSGNRCSFPGCDCMLDVESNGEHTIIGQECHIEARNIGGPRYNANLLNVDSHTNLILLCSIHHTIIDSKPEEYSVDVLKKMKHDHELLVSRSKDSGRLDCELFYADVIDFINKTMCFDNWKSWTSMLLRVNRPSINSQMANCIELTKEYLFGRVWPGVLPEYESLLRNYFELLSDLSNVFFKYAETDGDLYFIRKFYNDAPFEYKRSKALLEEYKKCISTVQNLVLELTRLSNFLCDETRKHIDQKYRIVEGKLSVAIQTSGTGECQIALPEYRNNERIAKPYPGLECFEMLLKSRDIYL